MYSYTNFILKSFCVRTQTLISACFGIEYKPPYIVPHIFTRYHPPPSAGQTVVGCSPPNFFLKFFSTRFSL